MLTKEEMALEALIKLATEATETNHIYFNTLGYAVEALKENGWEITVNEFGIARAIKIV